MFVKCGTVTAMLRLWGACMSNVRLILKASNLHYTYLVHHKTSVNAEDNQMLN